MKLDFISKHKHLRPVCLPNKKYKLNENDCWATGWGLTGNNGDRPDVLQQVKLPILSNDYCNERYNQFNPKLMICAGYKQGGYDTCEGDSGGPLVCSTSKGTWVQYGITSFGRGECGLENNPGYYTKVSNYIRWIKNSIIN